MPAGGEKGPCLSSHVCDSMLPRFPELKRAFDVETSLAVRDATGLVDFVLSKEPNVLIRRKYSRVS